MKYVIVLGDGMADYHRGPLGESTPLEKAKKPYIDMLAQKGVVGLVKTIPEGMSPASDVANLSVMGYDPTIYYSGRSPLEALSIGIDMQKQDVAMRVNLVTLSSDKKLEDKVMVDYCGGEISTKEADSIIKDIQKELGDERFSFFTGTSYRHCLIDNKGCLKTQFTPPHDISDKKIGKYLPKGQEGKLFREMIEKSIELLKKHPINKKRLSEGKNPVSSIWFWGAGTKPQLKSFEEKYKLKGAVISAVDLIKGIAKGANMKVYEVEGATGNINTNFMGKAAAAIKALKQGNDFVYLHIEAPDECSHQGDAKNKIKSIEKIDEVTGYIYENLKKEKEDFVIAVLCDHATPLVLKTHTSDPVPFLIYNSKEKIKSNLIYTEKAAKKGVFLDKGVKIIETMLKEV
ncbi:MAG: cofactor-independent phosphoglycerate mutase [Bacillota bacterium]